jgi:electron transport complex protein RnfA
MESLLLLFFSAVIINNVILTKFLGLCPFFGISKDLKAAFSMGLAVIFVMTLASIVTWLISSYILVPYSLEFLQTIIFILVVATLVQQVEMILGKLSPILQRVLGIYLPLITTNCAVLGICLLNVKEQYSLVETIVSTTGAGVGFTLAICIMAGLRERLMVAKVPAPVQGFPIAFIIGCMMALTASGFQGFFSH